MFDVDSKKKEGPLRPKRSFEHEPVVITVEDVTVSFNLAAEKVDSFKEFFIRKFKGQLHFEQFLAIKNVSLDVKRGEIFGIVGLNGSGKSTLLKVIAGVYRPTSGNCKVQGRIVPLIELGTGFDVELTGRENVFLNGCLLGYSEKFLHDKYDEIVDFAELHDFMDVPLKNYSSGMSSRLAFSIATVVEPDVLIADEVLSVGDFLFIEKCENRINKLIENGTTVLLVSHDINQIERMCDRAAFLKQGELVTLGDTTDVCEIYKNTTR